MDSNDSFCDILEDFLVVKGLTQTAFANLVGIKQSQVSEWLKGKSKPGYDSLRAICLALDISGDVILGLKDGI